MQRLDLPIITQRTLATLDATRDELVAQMEPLQRWAETVAAAATHGAPLPDPIPSVVYTYLTHLDNAHFRCHALLLTALDSRGADGVIGADGQVGAPLGPQLPAQLSALIRREAETQLAATLTYTEAVIAGLRRALDIARAVAPVAQEALESYTARTQTPAPIPQATQGEA